MHSTTTTTPTPAMASSIADEALPSLRHARTAPANRLPNAVLDLLLLTVDPATFASLALVNRHWRRRSNNKNLYIHHLLASTAHKTLSDPKLEEYRHNDLPSLKRHLAQAAKQNLFPAYRPRMHTFHIVAPPVLSSTSSPHGELFSYSFSPRGTFLAVCSASRIFVLSLQAAEPSVTRALAIKQRPVAVELSDDGATLALLVSHIKLQVFSLHAHLPFLLHAFLLTEPAQALALSPDSSVVAAGQANSIELFALSPVPGRVPRRVIACEEVSHLVFSYNGKLLLGSHTRSAKASTTVISSPDDMNVGMDEDEEEAEGDAAAPKEDLASIWVSRPLFPSAYEKTTHAAFIPGHEGGLLAFDVPADAFGILDPHLMSFSHTVLPVPSEFLLPSSLPSVTAEGDAAAIPFSRSGVRILSLADLPLEASDDPSSTPQRWIPFAKAVSRTKWQSMYGTRQRLFSVSAGRSTHPDLMNISSDEGRETGSLFTFDFDFHVDVTRPRDSVIDLSGFQTETLEADGNEEEMLRVQKRQSIRPSDRPKNMPLARSVTAARRKKRASMIQTPSEPPTTAGTEASDLQAPEEQHLDAPYHPSQPRPQSTLIRAASNIAARRDREGPRFVSDEPPRIRLPGDRGEVPDESDADNWVPPPPAYESAEGVEKKEENDEEERRRDIRGSRLPPVPPERSPNRPRLAVSTSTPDLTARSPSPQGPQREPEEQRTPSKGAMAEPRPRTQRVKSVYESARKSIVITGRRVFSGPSEASAEKAAEKPVEAAPPPLPRPSVLRQRQRPVSAAVSPEPPLQRRSVLPRPLSFASSGFLESRPGNRRSLSQPLPTGTSIHTISFPGSPDSPSLPSPAQIASLHRRQTSGSVSSVQSNGSAAAPRAAVGARRGDTTPNSPWASSTMLANIAESETGDGVESLSVRHSVNGRVASWQQRSPLTRPPQRLQEARASLNSAGTDGSRPNVYSDADSSNAEPGSNKDARPSTSPAGDGRLSTIQSIASTVKERSRSRPASRPRNGVHRAGSNRLSRKTKRESDAPRGIFAKVKQRFLSSLKTV